MGDQENLLSIQTKPRPAIFNNIFDIAYNVGACS